VQLSYDFLGDCDRQSAAYFPMHSDPFEWVR
jgi:hypothetical protein